MNQQFPDGARGKGLSLVGGNGCQPTSLAFMEACSTLEIHQVFTSYNNPKGNADTERAMRTMKEEYLWLQEWTCPFRTGKDDEFLYITSDIEAWYPSMDNNVDGKWYNARWNITNIFKG